MSRRAPEGGDLAFLPSRALRDLSAHYDLLSDAVLVELNDVLVYVNPAALAMFRCRDEGDLVGRLMLDLVPTEDHDAFRARNALAEEGHVHRRIRQRLIRVDGTVLPGEISSQAILLAPGTVGILVVVRDITRRHEEEAGFIVAFENAPVGLAQIGMDGRLLRVNRRLGALLGYQPADLVGRTIESLTSPEDRLIDKRDLSLLLGGEAETLTLQKRCVRRDGSAIWLNVTRTMVRKLDGTPDYVVALVEDVEQQRRSEQALRRSEERFRHLVEFGSELIVVVDPGGTIRYVARTVTALLGFLPEDVIGSSAFDFIHPDDRPASVARVERVLSVPGAREKATIRLLAAGGGWRTFEISNVNMLDVPSVQGLVINGHDITDTIRLAEDLAQMRRVESLGRVAAAVAHECNNILTGADAYTTVLMRRNDAAAEPIVKGLKAAISRAKQITAPLLQYGQPVRVEKATFNVSQWLEEVRSELESLVGPRHRIDITCDVDLCLTADPRQLTQVITNLVLNARDASRGGEAITISARSDSGGGVRLEVRDRGTGIDSWVRDRIFEPFFTTKHSGSGLGLAVVQQIVGRHDGTVSVESTPGMGSTFTVRLP